VQTPQRKRRSIAIMMGAIIALGLLAFPLRIAYECFQSERSSFFGQRHKVTPSADQAGIDGLVDVSFQRADGAVLRGWFAPGRTRAAVVLCHGTEDDRASMLPEARVLARAGFGVLLFDWPGNGESEGSIQLGDSERRALKTALEWLSHRPDVDPDRIGAFGFSIGGYIVAQVAADDRRLKAIIFVGAPGDLLATTRFQYRRWGVLSQWPALLADRLSGADLGEMRPKDLVLHMAPRPLLAIGGTEDPVVPVPMVRELYDALPEPKELWLIPSQQHGKLIEKAPLEYPRRIVDFYRRALGDH
jgi:dipeptidyl aminopeptidase/acylaminoacyl peptidase